MGLISLLYLNLLLKLHAVFLATFSAVFMNHLQMFPWLNHLEANCEAIRDELLGFVEKGRGMCNVHNTGGEELNKESK